MAKGRKANTKAPAKNKSPGNLELPEEEQWRIINETGILKKFPGPRASDVVHEEEQTPFADEVFNAMLLIIPMSFLLLLMEILVHWQYGRRPTYEALLDRMLPGVPILSLWIFYTTRYKRHRTLQFIFFLISLAVGPRLVWLINRASWRVVMKQCPPLATLWVYTILQLDLGPASLSLVIVAIWGKFAGMKIIQ
ncbi:hypothetical protein IEO21_00957 [Rhodonia placenta]|uniref:DUF7719 domain-containing protein n=1 Tax=Rhodonia placenta TaxID=104341 RepID=A0A8H7PAP2_9APHY|nr:hypothetical protein IEO21_00957 [Postia placenta]